MKKIFCTALILLTISNFSGVAMAFDINDKLSIGGIIAGIYQYRTVDDSEHEYNKTGRWGFPIQPEISFRPTKNQEFFVKLGFAKDNELNEDKEELLKNIVDGDTEGTLIKVLDNVRETLVPRILLYQRLIKIYRDQPDSKLPLYPDDSRYRLHLNST